MNLEPGLHPGLDMEAYLALRAVSNSWLSLFKQAPAKLWAELEHPEIKSVEETAATRLGTAIHTAILEPDSFKATYTKAGPCAAELASGQRKGEPCDKPGKVFNSVEGWRCGQHKLEFGAEQVVGLSPNDWRICMGLRDNALSRNAQFHNERARKLLRAKGGDVELTGVWDDGPTGERAKLRGDHVADNRCSDIKSTMDASPIGFPKQFYSMRYYAQQGHYNGGFEALEQPMAHHYIIACEKDFPYLIAVYRVVDEVINLAREEVRQLLDMYHQCRESGVWPGYPTKLLDLNLPYWGEKQLRAAIELEVR